MMPARTEDVFGSYSRDFWVSNILELFQKGAYYGIMAVLAVHLVKNLEFSAGSWGIISGFIFALLTFVPLASGALGEKYGYRTILVFSFLLMILGFVLLGVVGDVISLMIAIALMGIGAGAFSPIVSATLAHITTEAKRNMAYFIYYWMINFGGFIFPLSFGLFITTRQLFYMVFFISAVIILVNLIITLTMFRDPVEKKPDVSVSSAIMKILPALKDRAFLALLIIYSGFWFMDAIHLTFLPLYMLDFGKMPQWFNVLFLAAVHPGTIILLGPFLGTHFEKFDSIKVIILGLFIFSFGLMVLAFSIHPVIFISGIVIFSVGEFIVHPSFVSYVSKIAPTDKIAIYMASIFLPMGIGQILGGIVQGQWYQYFAVGLHQPKLYITALAAVGIITASAFLLYNRWYFYEMVKAGKRKEHEGGYLVRPAVPYGVLIIVPALVAAGIAGGTDTFYALDDASGSDIELVENSKHLVDITGDADERSESSIDIAIPDRFVTSITFTLQWQDEDGSDPRYTNNPDEFNLVVVDFEGTEKETGMTANPRGGMGEISLTFPSELDDETVKKQIKDDADGETECSCDVTIQCGDCGDLEPLVNPLRLREISDTGNRWTLSVDYTYLEPE